MPPISTAVRMTPLRLCSKRGLSSSMANTTPASGVLKAAAIPAAPPAMIRPEPAFLACKPRRRPNVYISAAPTCTVGPSRPTEAPQRSARAVINIFAAAIGKARAVLRKRLDGLCKVAITCGIPLPLAPLSQPCVAQASRAKPAGVTSQGHH